MPHRGPLFDWDRDCLRIAAFESGVSVAEIRRLFREWDLERLGEILPADLFDELIGATEKAQFAETASDPPRTSLHGGERVWPGGGETRPRRRSRPVNATDLENTWITRAHAAQMHDVSISTMKRWEKKLGLETRKTPGGRVLYLRAAIVALLESCL